MTSRHIKKSGFTLIELLVVIAIIGILASIVSIVLSEGRLKSRDAARVSDVRQLQLALELYFDTTNAFPATLAPLAPVQISIIPTDPQGNAYAYTLVGTSVTQYCLGIDLEASTEIPANHVEGCIDGTFANLGVNFAVSN